MRSFEQLSQDEQMEAVDALMEKMITSASHGHMPDCLLPFRQEIEQAISNSFLSRKVMLQDLLDQRHEIKIAMLHQAGSLAQRTWYLEPNDVVMPLSNRK